ncbi:hypothetical protein WOLCODRAFT_22649 [Wolfiporia cocos MD-104 SS10]|uniref:DUF6534 domain-containing protein n=1 Tax=Wolfiporia cocos (strain MD-104) TaxID=742152 RepID=A0A2H3J6K4_WOLCO|nr:hypothetical protein WOLCODRAFT_22649 [Wolfiporia cocos MD-104 SS10]
MIARLQSTLGALLVGSLFSTFLSGTVSMQVAFYSTVYQKDALRLKLTVSVIWLLDFLHTVFICVGDWEYLIADWGSNVEDWIPWSIAASVGLTALMTFVVQCFFAYRVYLVSREKLYFAVPLAFIALARLVAALVSTAMMVRLGSYSRFRHDVGWVFTLGLSLSAVLDVLVAATLCYFLRKNRSGFSSMDNVINALTFYTIQNGSMTFVATVAALACWVSLRNLVFLALHFVITKMYANAFLSTLNARKAIRLQQSSAERDPSLPVALNTSTYARGFEINRTHNHHTHASDDIPMTTKVHINVEESIHVDGDYEHETNDSDDPTKVPSDM